MTKKTFLGFSFGRLLFILASIPALVACGLLTKQPWYEMLLAVYSVVTLMLLAQGRRAGCALGTAYCLAYGALFFSKQVYGLAFFNILFGAPVYLVSFIAWGRHPAKQDTGHQSGETVEVRRLTPRLWALASAGSAIAFAGIFMLLRAVDSTGGLWGPLLDSLSLSLIAPALILLLLRYTENWWFNLGGSCSVLVLWVINTLRDTSNFNFVLIAALLVTTNAMGLVTWLQLERNAANRNAAKRNAAKREGAR